MKFFQTLEFFLVSCTKCVQSSEKSGNWSKAISLENCFKPEFPNHVKMMKINIIPTKDFLADTHIEIFICEISNFKIKWKEFVLAAGSFVESPFLNIFLTSLKKSLLEWVL